MTMPPKSSHAVVIASVLLLSAPFVAHAQERVTAVLVGSGNGAGLMRALNAADGSELATAAPFGASFRGGLRVAAGDVTGDGVPDFIVGGGNGGGQVRVIDGVGQSVAWTLPPFGGHSGDVYVAGGDIDADGRVDVLVGSGVGDGWLRVYSGLDQ